VELTKEEQVRREYLSDRVQFELFLMDECMNGAATLFALMIQGYHPNDADIDGFVANHPNTMILATKMYEQLKTDLRDEGFQYPDFDPTDYEDDGDDKKDEDETDEKSDATTS